MPAIHIINWNWMRMIWSVKSCMFFYKRVYCFALLAWANDIKLMPLLKNRCSFLLRRSIFLTFIPRLRYFLLVASLCNELKISINNFRERKSSCLSFTFCIWVNWWNITNLVHVRRTTHTLGFFDVSNGMNFMCLHVQSM